MNDQPVLPSQHMTPEEWVDQAGWMLLKEDTWDARDMLASYLKFVWGANETLAKADRRLGKGITERQVTRLIERAARTARRYQPEGVR